MYILTSKALGQTPLSYGSFAGTLGEPPLPSRLQNLLDKVKKNPHNYEALLLTSVFHVEPFSSDQLSRVLGETYLAVGGSLDQAKLLQKKVIQALLDIHAKYMQRNKQYSDLIDREKQLVNVVNQVFQDRLKTIEAEGVRGFEELLTRALLDPDSTLTNVGKGFALFHLPDSLTDRILNSRVPETHYARLGKALRAIAEQRQKKNAAFKKRVEQERKKQGQ